MNSKDPQFNTSEVSDSNQNERQQDLNKAMNYLHRCAEFLFNAGGGAYARPTEELFSGDGASIYTPIKIKYGALEIFKLLKLGWGEFSKNTFEDRNYALLSDFPYKIYVLRQRDSFLADEEVKNIMQTEPLQYLSSYSYFSSEGGRVVEMNTSILSGNERTQVGPIDSKEVPSYDDVLCEILNGIITLKSSPEEFSKFLLKLPKEKEQLKNFLLDHTDDEPLESIDKRDKELTQILIGMSPSFVRGNSPEGIISLIKMFDFETKSFKL